MSKKRKKPSWGAFPLMGAIPTGTVIQKGDPTADEKLREYRKRYDAAQKELAEAPIRKAEAELTQTIRELDKHARSFWSQQPIEAIIPKLYTEASKDFGLSGVPDTQGQYTMDELKQSVASWTDNEMAKTGYEITSEAAGQKFVRYLLAQAFHGKDVRSSITACFLRLVEMGAFVDGDLTYDPSKAPRPVEAPAPKANLDELLNTVSAESTEGRKKLIEAVTDAAITGEFRACWQAFVTSIYENFGHVFTEQEKKLIYDTMIRRNRNFNRPADYDEIRVALAQSNNLPPHLVYPSERLALDVESADMSDWNVRREFARRTRELADQAN
jgi:hypothetical protein